MRCLLVCNAPSLLEVKDAVNASKLPKVCVNNSIGLVEPDYWTAGDAYVEGAFPGWIWKHDCQKYLPNPNGNIRSVLKLRPCNEVAFCNHFKYTKNLNLIEPEYKYDKETFLTSENWQVGYTLKSETFIEVAGKRIQGSSASFLLGIRLCVELGFDEIVLAGVDLTTPKTNFYAWDNRVAKTIQMDKEIIRMEFTRRFLMEFDYDVRTLKAIDGIDIPVTEI